MLPVKAAIFDIGATLVTGPPVAPNKVIAKLLGVPASEVGSIIMTTDLASAEHVCRELTEKFGIMNDEAAGEICKLWDSQTTAAQALEGASETVIELKKAGLKIGLLSDIWNPYYESVKVALPEVISAADAIVLSCKSGSRKPDKANFEQMTRELDIKPSECVMVGDTYTHDIKPALDMGMQAVWVLARPDREAESIIEILNGNSPAPSGAVASISEVIEFFITKTRRYESTK